MKRLLKTLLLMILIFALTKFKPEGLSLIDFFAFMSFGLSLVVLVGGFYYLIKVKKVKLFLIAGLMFFLSSVSHAQIFDTKAIDLDDVVLSNKQGYTLSDFGSNICTAKENGYLDLKALKQAQAIVDYWNKQGVIPSIIGGGDKNYECARNYIKYAAALDLASRATCSPARAILKSVAEKDKCWPCDVTATILSGIQQVATKSYNAVNNAAKIALGVGYLFWLSVTILVSFAKFGFEKFGEFFTKLLNQTILVMIIALILHAPLAQFYKNTISPFISFSAAFSMRLSEETLEIKAKNGSLFDKILDKIGFSATDKCSYCKKMHDTSSVNSGNFIDSSAINSILCLTCSTYKQTAPMISIGQTMVCLGRMTPTTVLSEIPGLNTISSFIGPNFQVALMGLALVLIFSVLTFLVAYFIMTSVLKLGVSLILMPLFITAYAFKSTRIYANKAWGLIAFSMTNIMVVSLSISFVTIGFSSLLPTASALNVVNLFLSSDGGGLATLMGASNPLANMTSMDGETIQNLVNSASNSDATMRLLTMAAFAYIGIHLISGSATITEQLTNSWQLNSAEGQILSQALTGSVQQGISGAKAIWSGVKIGKGLASKNTKAIVNGQEVMVNESEAIQAAKRSLEEAEKNPISHTPNQYTTYEKMDEYTKGNKNNS